ncbi:MAG: PilZ domain protein [Candidatus Omnitrophica bacterium ADurb.Bin277]|nr:MAG: PilZ domain protein [Candidatus Omnitrophica bacterium ADurb.Bin277]
MKITRNSRQHKRARVQGLLKCSSVSESRVLHLSNVREISEGGLSFVTNKLFDPGQELRVSILLHPNETPMEINAVVARCIQVRNQPPTYQTGLRFTDVSEKQQNQIRETIRLYPKNKKRSISSLLVIRLRG